MDRPALLLIDVQQGFDEPCWGQRNNLSAEVNIARLLTAWREQSLPVIHIQHSSTNPSSPLHPDNSGFVFKPEVAPLKDEAIFVKNVNSAFIGTKLESYLRENDINSLVIAGLTTDHCVSTTTRMAGNFGFEVRLVSDGTATFDRTDTKGEPLSADVIHRVHLASLHGEFCTVVTTNTVLADITHDQRL